jgi:hypothetical protein
VVYLCSHRLEETSEAVAAAVEKALLGVELLGIENLLEKGS